MCQSSPCGLLPGKAQAPIIMTIMGDTWYPALLGMADSFLKANSAPGLVHQPASPGD